MSNHMSYTKYSEKLMNWMNIIEVLTNADSVISTIRCGIPYEGENCFYMFIIKSLFMYAFMDI